MIFSDVKNIFIPEGSVKKITAGEVVLWQSGRLPSGYTELEYIETDGESWIDTGVNAYSYNDKVLRYYFKGNAAKYLVAGGNNYVFGCLSGGKRSGNISFRGTNANKTTLYVGANSNEALNASYVPPVGSDFEINLTANSNDESTVVGDLSGNAFVRTTNTLTESTMPNANIWLGYCNGVGSTSKAFVGKIYSFTIGTTDGTAIRDFIPAKRDSDGTIGMVDLVSQTFFTNAGTGTFTAGAVV